MIRVSIGILFFSISVQFASAQGLLWNNNIENRYDSIKEVDGDRSAFLPDSVELTKYITYSHFQLGYDCVPYAIANTLSIINAYKSQLKNQKEISMESFSPTYLYNLLRNKIGFNNGFDINKALDAIIDNGIAKIKNVEYPNYYPFTNFTSIDFLEKQDSTFFVVDYKRMTSTFKKWNIQWSLYQHKPCIVGIKYTNSFQKAKNQLYWDLLDSEKYEDALHAIVIIGYKDNIIIGDDKGAFLILNSWGKKWGDDGLIWISYNDFDKLYVAGWVIQDFKFNNSNINSMSYYAPDTVNKIDITNTNFPDLLE